MGLAAMRGLAPTALGLKGIFFVGVIVLAYSAAPYLNLFFMLLGFLGVLGVLAVPWTYNNLRGVSAEFGEIHPVPVGVGGELTVTVRSKARRFAINPIVRINGRWRLLPTIATVEPGELVHRCRLGLLPRGVHRVDRVALESSYPLGLLRRRVPMPGPCEVIVHPVAADLPQARSRGTALAALLGTASIGGGGTEPSGLRPWREGDEQRTVHWRASARSTGLVVVEREAVADRALEVVFDQRAPAAAAADEPTPFEGALALLTALALRCVENEAHLTVRAQGIDRTFGDGHGSWRELLRWLALAQPLPMDGPAPPSGGAGALRLPVKERERRPPAQADTAGDEAVRRV